MARIRTIKPEITQSVSMGRVTREARLLFILMFTLADDEGRFRADSLLLASVLYPRDRAETDLPDKIDGWLRELSREVCITLYKIDGDPHIQINNWLKHQKIDHPSASKLPPPPGGLASVREEFAEPRASRARGLDQGKGSGREEDLDQDLGEEGTGLVRSREGAGTNEPGQANPAGWPADYRAQFEELYPNKVAMEPALKALDIAKASGGVSWRVLVAALEAYAAKTDDRAFLNPKRWIEEKRWNDRYAKPSGDGAKPSAGDRARRLARQMEACERDSAHQRPPDAVGGDELGGDDARLVPGAKPDRRS